MTQRTSHELNYEQIPTRNLTFEVATAGQGDHLALLLHGFPESAHSYRHQIPHLVRLGYRVWAPNLRGYGRTDSPKGRKAYSMHRLMQDVTDLLDASGARDVTLIGHDWGGAIAWNYAMYGAFKLKRLVVLNCPHPAVFARSLWRPSQLARSSYMFFFQMPWLPERLIAKDEGRRAARWIRDSSVNPERLNEADLGVLASGMSRPKKLTPKLNYYRALPFSLGSLRNPPVIEVPTLLLWGEQDQVLRKNLIHGTGQLVRNLTVHLVPDASHWVQQDAPEAINQALEEWLPRHSFKPATRAAA